MMFHASLHRHSRTKFRALVNQQCYYNRTLVLAEGKVSNTTTNTNTRRICNGKKEDRIKYIRLFCSASPPNVKPNQEQNEDGDNGESQKQNDFNRNDSDGEENVAKYNGLPSFFPWKPQTTIPKRLMNMATRGKLDDRSNAEIFRREVFRMSTVIGWYYLQVPWYKVLGRGWRYELAESFSWAFTQTMIQVFSNLYKVPIENITTSNYDNDDDDDDGDDDEQFGIDLDAPLLLNKTRTDKKDDDGDVSLVHIMEPKLLNMYESIPLISNMDNSNRSSNEENINKSNRKDDGSTNSNSIHDSSRTNHQQEQDLHVKLKMKPTSSFLFSLHCIPYFSRNILKWKPSFLKEYHAFARQPTFAQKEILWNYLLHEYGKIETTIIAEVVINCEEIFQVTCLKTGKILQGGSNNHDDKKKSDDNDESDDNNSNSKNGEVIHTARFELIHTWCPKEGGRMGDWILLDVDDLLNGNKWYRGPPGMRKSRWWKDG